MSRDETQVFTENANKLGVHLSREPNLKVINVKNNIIIIQVCARMVMCNCCINICAV